VGVCRPFSSFETFDGGHASDSASCLPVRPACCRSSRSRLPSALRASWTLVALLLLFGGKVIPSSGVVPGGVTPVVVLHDQGRIFDQLAALEAVRIIEVHPNQLTAVEQPVIVTGQFLGFGFIAGEIPNILARAVGEL